MKRRYPYLHYFLKHRKNRLSKLDLDSDSYSDSSGSDVSDPKEESDKSDDGDSSPK